MNKIVSIKNGKIVEEKANSVKPNETSARHNREAMKTKHRKDMLQKNETGYYRAYPEQLDNLSDETKRLLS